MSSHKVPRAKCKVPRVKPVLPRVNAAGKIFDFSLEIENAAGAAGKMLYCSGFIGN